MQNKRPMMQDFENQMQTSEKNLNSFGISLILQKNDFSFENLFFIKEKLFIHLFASQFRRSQTIECSPNLFPFLKQYI